MSDLDGNGRITKTEFINNLPNTPLAGSTFDQLSWPSSFSWPERGLAAADIRELRNWRIDQYHEDRDFLLSKPPGALFSMPVNGRVVPRSSFSWFHTFHRDWTPVAGMLGTYDGPIHLFYGTLDSSVEPHRQLAVARQLLGKAQLEAKITRGLGHTLGEHPKFGPIRVDQQQAIVAAASRIADNCAATR
jgi:hypothetical protein